MTYLVVTCVEGDLGQAESWLVSGIQNYSINTYFSACVVLCNSWYRRSRFRDACLLSFIGGSAILPSL